ncbi:MAG: protein kinase [Byssovorax sp.]
MRFVPPPPATLAEPLGRGSIFDVALVREHDRVLVCKRLLPRTRGEPAARRAMVREARFLALARHPSLPSLVRVGSDEHGPFVLETQAPGLSFRALAEGWAARGSPLPPRLWAHLALAAATALAELHELADDHGPLALVHGDLGPEHVHLGPLGEIAFVDFGAARFRGMEPELETGDAGTLPFVAPEIARGEARSSAAADTYALAATLLHLAIGAPLVAAADRAAALVAIGERGLSPDLVDRAPGLSIAARDALREALRFDPAARLASSRALVEALAR